DEVLKLLAADIIYPISDSKWVSPTQVVPKKSGLTVIENANGELIPSRKVTGWRMCIDYRKSNSASRKDHFSLPFLDQILEKVASNSFYCFLDGFSGYYQIAVAPEDQEKTTFTCPFGTFAFRRMPFGLCNAPATFQRCMMSIFFDMLDDMCGIFMDDFSVFDKSFDYCLTHLIAILKRCEEKNLLLNWEKCQFMVRSGLVLGHLVSERGIEVDRAKVELISQLPIPKTVRDIRSFLGYAGFYRHFIEGFSRELKRTPVILSFADRSVKVHRGVVEDILVKVDTFYFPVDFVVLDMEPTDSAKKQILILLGRSFLVTANTCVQCRTGVMDISFGNMKLRLNVFCASQQASYDVPCKDVDMVDECVEEVAPSTLFRDPLEARLQFDRSSILGLEDPCEHAFVVCNLAFSLKKRPYKSKFKTLRTLSSIPERPFIKAPSSLELKPLPASLKLNPNVKEVVLKEVVKCLNAGRIFPTSDSEFVSPMQVVPKKLGITIIENDKGEAIPTCVTSG
ncbi:uncharacterized protein LOC131143831, partial [Malania oleifera]|uniref:uncharacterized protein LOC131143831 n=1 Tax=Malania oleifera TaxID=397392 RepID=UPI0025AE0854